MIPGLFADIIGQPHTLIAGSTGSGKSVLLRGILAALHEQTPYHTVLIDPKRVELWSHRTDPACIRYASEPDGIIQTLSDVCGLMDGRYQILRQQGTRDAPPGWAVYIIIDELADLLTTRKKQATPLLARIAQLGRAAGIHMIAATQRPTRDVIAGQIAVNIDSRIALRVPTAQDSRNLIHQAGAERLPRYGYGYYLTPSTFPPALVQIPFTL